MDPQRTLRVVVPVGIALGLGIPGVILGAHAYRRSQARQLEAARLATEQAEITVRLEGLLYSATKRARDCRVDEAMDYRRRAQELNSEIAARQNIQPPNWSLQLAELSKLLAECDAVAKAKEDARQALENSRRSAITQLEQSFALRAAAYDFAGMESLIAANQHIDANDMLDGYRRNLDARRAEWSVWQVRLTQWSNFARDATYVVFEHVLPCASCGGRGEGACPDCKGTLYALTQRPCPKSGCTAGKTSCFSCGGTGFINCFACGGRGSVEMVREVSTGGTLKTQQSYSVSCTLCHGSRGKKCSRCGGKAGNMITCDECKGAAVVQRNTRCSNCKTGKISCSHCAGNGRWRRY